MTSENSPTHRKPRDHQNPDGWEKVVADMLKRARQLGLDRLKGDDE